MKHLKIFVVTVLTFSMLVMAGPVFASNNVGLDKISTSLLDKSGQVEVIITLNGKTSTDFLGEYEFRNEKLARIVENSIDSYQDVVFDRCESISSGITKSFNYNTVLNGFACTVEAKDLTKIAKLPSIKRIYDATYRYQMTLDKHHGSVGVTKLRNAGTAQGGKIFGKNIKVGIIDSGINYKHTALGEKFGNRVKTGYDFADKDNDPMDFMGHGTHVAGIVGASGQFAGKTVQGAAPDVTFGAYKVFTNNEGGARPANVAAAIERSVKDKCHIINLSLGRALFYGGEDALEDEALLNAAKAGTLPVVAAGNDGFRSSNLQLPIGVPSVSEGALCVAASDSSKKAVVEIPNNDGSTRLIALNNHIWGAHPIKPDFVDTEIVDCGSEPTKFPDCTGKIAFVSLKDSNVRGWHRNDGYGIISTLAKIKCIGYILWSEKQDGIAFVLSYFKDAVEAFTYPVPIYTCSGRDGKFLKQAAIDGIKIRIKRVDFPAEFSSVGPYIGQRGFTFKPEVAAPGMWILSTYYDETDLENSWMTSSGTSMASPYVAGMCALVKQYRPEWGQKWIKNAVMNTAKFMINPFNNQPFPLVMQGSGLINAYDACTTQLLVDPPSFTFTGRTYNQPMKFNLYNVDLTKKSIKVVAKTGLVGDIPGLDLNVTFDSEVIMPPNEKSPKDPAGSMQVTVSINKDTIPKDKVIEGWIEITVDDFKTVHVPFMALFGPFKIYTSASPFDSISLQNTKINLGNGDIPGKIKFELGTGSRSFLWDPNQYDNFSYMVRIAVIDGVNDRWRDIYEANFLAPGQYEFDWDGKDLDGQPFLPEGDQPLGFFLFKDSIVGRELNKLFQENKLKDPDTYITVFNSSHLPLPGLVMSVNPDVGAVGKKAYVKLRFNRGHEIRVIRFFLLYDPKAVSFTGQYMRGEMAADKQSVMISVEDGGDGRMMVEILPVYQGIYMEGSGDLIELEFMCQRRGGVEFDTSFVEIKDKSMQNTRFVRPLSIELPIVDRYLMIGDFNIDWSVDEKDLFIISSIMGKKESEEGFNKHCDINRNGLIDFDDLGYFAKHFGEKSETPK
jgi:minor extracellular serine protease Vpr